MKIISDHRHPLFYEFEVRDLGCQCFLNERQCSCSVSVLLLFCTNCSFLCECMLKPTETKFPQKVTTHYCIIMHIYMSVVEERCINYTLLSGFPIITSVNEVENIKWAVRCGLELILHHCWHKNRDGIIRPSPQGLWDKCNDPILRIEC